MAENDDKTGLVRIAAVGDVATKAEFPGDNFDLVMDQLRDADIRFAQCERVYSERGSFQGQGLAPHVRQHPRMAETYKTVPIEVVGVGGNHTGDWGPEAAEDTIAAFEALGLHPIGAGRTIAEARTPRIIGANGMRVAFLGYASVLLPQYWATEDRTGATPMRAKTYYEPYEYQPGAPLRIVTIPHQQDLEDLQADVRRAKEQADAVVVSFHWGVHWIAKPLADYQPIVAHAAVDAGASVILGHHPHVVQAIEAYRQAVIFYSLGNFSFYRRPGSPNYLCPQGEFEFKDAYDFDLDPGHFFAHNRHFGEGYLFYVDLDRNGVRKVSLIPTPVNEKGQAKQVQPGSEPFESAHRYLEWVSDSIDGGLTEVRVDGDRLVLLEQ
jgi:hypothetical protein